MIEIVEASESHFPIIQQLAHQTWPHTFGAILSKEQIAYMLQMMYSEQSLADQVNNKKHRFLLVREGTDFLAYASYEIGYKLKKTKIHKLYVLPSAQGKGLGKLLINKIADIARQSDNRVLSLNVNRNNPATQFYERLGFQIKAQENIDIGQTFLMEDYVMELNVSYFDSI
ncbi:GNAT family N-acetyltransferase [Olivibacter sitiensis]|uniref:GNAT family N-acetyltransferase n=1 Tax=Olivibacter sitiensis TaxID=376470 RepID=UPI0003F88F55|nr:GNAT family N-acetyltransferase [Olivibacter sitiensis]